MVAPDLQGTGLGRAIMEFVETRAPCRRDDLWLNTGHRSERLIRMYKKAGYRLSAAPADIRARWNSPEAAPDELGPAALPAGPPAAAAPHHQVLGDDRRHRLGGHDPEQHEHLAVPPGPVSRPKEHADEGTGKGHHARGADLVEPGISASGTRRWMISAIACARVMPSDSAASY